MNKDCYVSVTPNWEVSDARLAYYFDVSISVDGKIYFSDTVKTSVLVSNLILLSEDGEAKGDSVYVYATHNGDMDLVKIYSQLMDILNSDNFHMEYEHG